MSQTSDKLPPHEPVMERAILGCILQEPQYADECISRFKAGSEIFFDLKNRQLYEAVIEMRKSGEPIDLITVSRKFNDAAYLAECSDAAPSVANFEFYADKVSEAFMLRKAMMTCVEAVGTVYNNTESAEAVITGIEAKLSSIRQLRGTEEIVGSKKAGQLLIDHLEQRYNLQGRKSGIETGFNQFDNLTDGLQFGELTVIGARPSQGKTALATCIVHQACLKAKLPTLFVTLEMSIPSLCRRIISNHCKIGMHDLKAGRFSENDFAAFSTFREELARSPLYFLDTISGSSIDRIAGAIRRICKSAGVKLVIVDYLQKIKASSSHEKRTYEVAEVSSTLKAVAVETGAAVVALAQLNREPDKQKGRLPQISDLADSAQIERDADLIALLHRDRSENDGREASLLIAKQRDGELGLVELVFNGRYAAFENKPFDHE